MKDALLTIDTLIRLTNDFLLITFLIAQLFIDSFHSILDLLKVWVIPLLISFQMLLELWHYAIHHIVPILCLSIIIDLLNFSSDYVFGSREKLLSIEYELIFIDQHAFGVIAFCLLNLHYLRVDVTKYSYEQVQEDYCRYQRRKGEHYVVESYVVIELIVLVNL